MDTFILGMFVGMFITIIAFVIFFSIKEKD